MRPNIARALTAALATTGAAGAIVLPTLTLGDARTPPHAFAIPAPSAEIEIEATRVPPRAGTAQPVRPVFRPATPTRVQARSARRGAPSASPRTAAPAPTADPVVVPTPLPAQTITPSPSPAPEPEPTPEAPPVRAVTFVAPVEEEPNDDATAKDTKDKKEKKDKKDKSHKNKLPETDDPALAPPPADPVAPTEPLPADEADEDEGKKHDGGKEHDDHGKGHDKKK